MTGQPEWEASYERELQRGIAARAAGNEGMARVCARRAAAELLRAHFRRTGRDPEGISALNLLRALRDSGEAPADVRRLAGYFILQITEEHVLPGGIDLVAEVQRLRKALFPES